jgi:hypothetical protein
MMIPGMVELRKEYGEQGLAIVSISLRDGGPGVVNAFNKEFGVNYSSVMGSEEVVRAFGAVQGSPLSLVIERQGLHCPKTRRLRARWNAIIPRAQSSV